LLYNLGIFKKLSASKLLITDRAFNPLRPILNPNPDSTGVPIEVENAGKIAGFIYVA
jgi:hypothetical protein